MTAGVLVSSNAIAQATPRIPRTALPTGFAGQPLAVGSATVRSPQVIAGSFDPYRVSGNTATITQRAPSGILRWESFDIGADAQVEINQPSPTAVLLNKVDGGISPTVIEGILKANGQVYIYNPNGILFGKTANINTNTLVATSLKIDDKRFLAGILAPSMDSGVRGRCLAGKRSGRGDGGRRRDAEGSPDCGARRQDHADGAASHQQWRAVGAGRPGGAGRRRQGLPGRAQRQRSRHARPAGRGEQRAI